MDKLSVLAVLAFLIAVFLPESSSIIVSYSCKKSKRDSNGWRLRYYLGTCQKTKAEDGGWSGWTDWQDTGTCSVTCGVGNKTQEHTRTCDNPPPTHGGADCSGPKTETRTVACGTTACAGGDVWSVWSFWKDKGDCSVTCGDGGLKTQERTRTCSNPANGGSACLGKSTETRVSLCRKPKCKVHGGWSNWSIWKDKRSCSVECGGGTKPQERSRSCDNPVPAYGGNNCSGNSIETKMTECNTAKCPVNGGWSIWGPWKNKTDCSVTCGGGVKTEERSRLCDNPAPAYGGTKCAGNNTDTRIMECNTVKCKVHGGWSKWTHWRDQVDCSVSCGGGTKKQERSRACDNPKPAYGGSDCVGGYKENQTVSCATHECYEGWSNWTLWEDTEECNVLCGGGEKVQERSRDCVDPIQGTECPGEGYENRTVLCGSENCGDRCPSGEVRYLPHPTNPGSFYQCSNGVAYLHNCAAGQQYNNGTCTPVSASSGANDVQCTDGVVTLADATDCHKYYVCDHGNKIEMMCPGKLKFYAEKGWCDFGKC